MGSILSNGKIPRLVVAELEENMYEYVSKMGFSHLFEDVEIKAPVKKKKVKKSNDSTKTK